MEEQGSYCTFAMQKYKKGVSADMSLNAFCLCKLGRQDTILSVSDSYAFLKTLAVVEQKIDLRVKDSQKGTSSGEHEHTNQISWHFSLIILYSVWK